MCLKGFSASGVRYMRHRIEGSSHTFQSSTRHQSRNGAPARRNFDIFVFCQRAQYMFERALDDGTYTVQAGAQKVQSQPRASRLAEMSIGLRALGAEGRTESVDSCEGRGERFEMQLGRGR